MIKLLIIFFFSGFWICQSTQAEMHSILEEQPQQPEIAPTKAEKDALYKQKLEEIAAHIKAEHERKKQQEKKSEDTLDKAVLTDKQKEADDAAKKHKEAGTGQSNFTPLNMVALPNGLLMSKYEITQGQWQQVMGSKPSKFFTCGLTCPVEQVSWDDIQLFINRLNISGKHYRLPTEEEWFVACQAGKKTVYCGSDDISEVAWHQDNSANTIHAVGQKQPNAWGLYDMTGNVWEWTNSCSDNKCVTRGGAFYGNNPLPNATLRYSYVKAFNAYVLGFRVVQDP